jgi:membrane associated rhomboid family serine protease
LPEIRLHRPGFDVLTVLCVLMVVVQGVVSALGGFERVPEVFEWFGLSLDGLMRGRVWQLGTHALLHGNWLHFLINWLVIFLIGGRIYHIMGGRGLAVIFVGGVLLASMFHLVFHPARPIGIGEVANAPLVGASGGAMALLIALTSLSPDSRMWPVPVSGKNLGKGLMLAALLFYLITPGLGVPGLSRVGNGLVAAGFGSLFEVAHIYHFGGGLLGLLYVRRLLRRPVTLEELQARREKREKRKGLAA